MADYTIDRAVYRQSASRLTIIAHLFGILAFILMLVWLLHFREGIEYDSDNLYRVFNVHPFLMFCGFIFLAGEAMMAYKTVPSQRAVQKFVHMILHLIALCLGIVGICAVFKFHDMVNAEDVYSLHSWIGLGTFCLFGLQFLGGFFTFMVSSSSQVTRARMLPWHVCGGRALLYMAICAALTGLMEKSTYLRLEQHRHEARLINFTGLAILLFGIFVDLSVALARYKSRSYQVSATPVTLVAHLLVIAVTTLILVWLLHFRGGFAFKSSNKEKILNIHTFLMAVGFILFAGEAMMAYKSIPGSRQAQKASHLTFHMIALVAGVLGVYAAFKFKHEINDPDMNTLHCWLGIITICLFVVQWMLGFFSFVFPRAELSTRGTYRPWHVFGGMVIFFMAICTAEMGLLERYNFLGLGNNQEGLIVNFTGLLLVLFAIGVGLSGVLPRGFK
ncbi:hypothetical protein Tsubulata_033546 [Turnera subulata]|uniref:ascorbate ferrireductase (transmembrane) n=1 Tax=Turnera subulata TaxID=218843 RepID=A0A9Q0GKI8_9ROSI|nr:hypothetical protein Tsubulata_033546 [Turnera subulata]